MELSLLLVYFGGLSRNEVDHLLQFPLSDHVLLQKELNYLALLLALRLSLGGDLHWVTFLDLVEGVVHFLEVLLLEKPAHHLEHYRPGVHRLLFLLRVLHRAYQGEVVFLPPSGDQTPGVEVVEIRQLERQVVDEHGLVVIYYLLEHSFHQDGRHQLQGIHLPGSDSLVDFQPPQGYLANDGGVLYHVG